LGKREEEEEVEGEEDDDGLDGAAVGELSIPLVCVPLVCR
jgi:hypothetical protein